LETAAAREWDRGWNRRFDEPIPLPSGGVPHTTVTRDSGR
jgi:hypothetical protein